MSLHSLANKLKHMAGKHNQKTHGHGHGHGSEGVKPTLTEYVQEWKLRQFDLTSNKPVVSSLADLPATKPGTTRILHGTSLYNFQSIDTDGVLTGKEVGKKEHLSEVLGYGEQEYLSQGSNAFGELVVVADVPSGDVRSINSSWLSVNRSISPAEITGYVIGKVKIDSSELPAIMADYKREFE